MNHDNNQPPQNHPTPTPTITTPNQNPIPNPPSPTHQTSQQSMLLNQLDTIQNHPGPHPPMPEHHYRKPEKTLLNKR